MISQVLKWILISIGIVLLCFSIYIAIIWANWPNHQEMMQAEEEYHLEQEALTERCKRDSIGASTPREIQLNDSMQRKKFEYFKIERVYSYSICKDYKDKFRNEEFVFRYKRRKPVLLKLKPLSEQHLWEFTKHVFTHYVSNEDIMKYEHFKIKDDFFGENKELSRQEILDHCGMIIEKNEKNQWVRTILKTK